MAALEHRILTQLLLDGSLQEAVEAGLMEEEFKDAEAKRIWREIRKHWFHPSTYHTLPTLVAIQRRYPSFRRTAPESKKEKGAIKALIRDLKVTSYESDVRGLATFFQELVDTDPDSAAKQMMVHLSGLVCRKDKSETIGVSEILGIAEDHYKDAEDGAIYGLPWPWEPLTADTLGKNPGDFIVMYSRMKQMKCVCEGQRIMSHDGSLVSIEDLPEVTMVPSYTEEDGKIRISAARRVVSGVKDCVETTTESGLKLATSRDHLFMVPGGYKRIKDLNEGDYVATARWSGKWSPSDDGFSEEDAHFMGLLVGDGNYTRNEVQFTKGDRGVVEAVSKHASRSGCELTPGSREGEYRIVCRDSRNNPVLDLLRSEGIHGTKGPEKRAPEKIFRSTPTAIAAFVAGLLDTDGTVDEQVVSWCSSSRELISDLQHLLMRFRVRGSIVGVTTNMSTKAYNLYVYSKENACVLDEILGGYLSCQHKKTALKNLANRKVHGKRNRDAVPYTAELETLILGEKRDHCWPKSGSSYFDRSKLFVGTDRISRYLLRKLADHFDSDELARIADQDIVWEKIKSVKSIGRKPCYDICIEDDQDPNFVVEGLVVHNTWVALYCAAYDYLFNNARVMFWSREMGKAKAALRLASIFGGVDYQIFKRGKLPPPVLRRMRDAFDMLKQDDFRYKGTNSTNGRDLRLLAGRNAPVSLDQIVIEIQTFRPEIVYLDSFYHIDPGGKSGKRWERLAMLGERCKIIAEDESVPIIAIHQANRLGDKVAGSTMADVADSDVLAREATLVVRIVKNRNQQLQEEEYEQWWDEHPDGTEEELEEAILETEYAEEAEIEEALEDNDVDLSLLVGAKEELEEEEPPKPKRKIHFPKAKKAKKVGKPKPETEVREPVKWEAPNYDTPRIGTKLGLVFGGNRDGTLEAIVINAIPGYDFNFVSLDYSVEDIEGWLDNDKKGPKGRPPKKDTETPQINVKSFRKFKKDSSENSGRKSRKKGG